MEEEGFSKPWVPWHYNQLGAVLHSCHSRIDPTVLAANAERWHCVSTATTQRCHARTLTCDIDLTCTPLLLPLSLTPDKCLL